MKNLVDYIYEEEKQYIELNSALAGEIFLYSETSKLFSERKEAICKAFKERLKPELIAADYISHTLVFKKYIKDLIIYYEKYVDNDAKISLSTTREIKRQIANSMVLHIRNYNPIDLN